MGWLARALHVALLCSDACLLTRHMTEKTVMPKLGLMFWNKGAHVLGVKMGAWWIANNVHIQTYNGG